MALLFLEGFEGYSATSELTSLGSTNTCRITQVAGSSWLTLNSTTYRTIQPTAANSRSLALSGTGAVFVYLNFSLPSRTEIIMGMGIRFWGGDSTNAIIAIGGPSPRSASSGIVITANMASGVLSAYTNSSGGPGTLLGILSGSYSPDIWYFIEIRLKVGSTTGELQIKINGSDVLNLMNVNTATGSLSSYTGMSIYTGGSNSTADFYIDDLYICDTTGTNNNTFIGPLSVYSLMPISNGSSTQLTPVGAAANWSAVSEGTVDTGTYVETSTTGQKDYYNFQALPAGVTTVHGVKIKATSTTVDNGGRKLQLNMKNGLSVLSSSLRNLALSSWIREYFLSETAPDGSAWTKELVESTEAGIEAGE